MTLPQALFQSVVYRIKWLKVLLHLVKQFAELPRQRLLPGLASLCCALTVAGGLILARFAIALAPSLDNGENTGPGKPPGCFMVRCIGTLATRSCEPRQARKGAAAAVDSGAGMLLVQGATLKFCPCPGVADPEKQLGCHWGRQRLVPTK